MKYVKQRHHRYQHDYQQRKDCEYRLDFKPHVSKIDFFYNSSFCQDLGMGGWGFFLRDFIINLVERSELFVRLVVGLLVDIVVGFVVCLSLSHAFAERDKKDTMDARLEFR